MVDRKCRLKTMTVMAAVVCLASPAFAQNAPPTPAPQVNDPLSAAPATTLPSNAPTPTITQPADPLSPTATDEATAAPSSAAEPGATTGPAARTIRRPVRRSPSPDRSAPLARLTKAAPPAQDAAPATAALPTSLAAPLEPAEAATTVNERIDFLAIALVGGLSLLALLGIAIALRRRKRREEQVDAASDEPRFDQRRIPVAFDEPLREPRVSRAAASTTAIAATRLRRATEVDPMVRTDVEPSPPILPQPPGAPTPGDGTVASKLSVPRSQGSFLLGGGPDRPVPGQFPRR